MNDFAKTLNRMQNTYNININKISEYLQNFNIETRDKNGDYLSFLHVINNISCFFKENRAYPNNSIDKLSICSTMVGLRDSYKLYSIIESL